MSMLTRMKSLLIWLTFLLPGIYAQAEVVRFVAVEKTLKDLYYMSDSSEYVRVQLVAYQRTEPLNVRLSENRQLVLYRQEEVNGKQTFVPSVSAVVSNGVDQMSAIVYVTQNGPRMEILDDSFAAFPVSSLRIVNISPVRILSKIGDKVVEVGPLAHETVPVVHEGKRPVVSVVTVHEDQRGEWLAVYNQPTAVLPNWRVTGVAVVTRGGLAKAQGLLEEEASAVGLAAKMDFFTFKDTTGPRAR